MSGGCEFCVDGIQADGESLCPCGNYPVKLRVFEVGTSSGDRIDQLKNEIDDAIYKHSGKLRLAEALGVIEVVKADLIAKSNEG